MTSDGGASVYERGVCWSISRNPTTADSKTSDGMDIGPFTSSLTGLQAGTVYYVRAYATNSTGTGYGNEVSFTTRFTVTYDGNGNTGGTAPADALSYTQGQTVTVLGNSGNLVLPGYDLTSWNTLANGSGTSYPAPFGQTFIMGSANVTLYAQWVLAPAVWDKAIWDLSKWQ